MNAPEQLLAIAKKPKKLILGLMSGTSLDGLDMALCLVEGVFTETKVQLLKFRTTSYDDVYRERIQRIFCKRQVDLQELCLLNAWVARYHSELVINQLKLWGLSPKEVDILSSHGQTVYHAPKSFHKSLDMPFNATLQIGDGDHLAALTGILTVSDFRQKHIAHGGEGAPLAPYGDFLLCTSEKENRVLLNIGGISNLTFLPNSRNFAQVLCSDIGPGNTIIDGYVQRHFYPLTFDNDAQIASKGSIDEGLLTALLRDSFFSRALPKSTGQELFNFDYFLEAQRLSNTQNLSHPDVLRTLVRFSARAISDFLGQHLSTKAYSLYVSGGGAYNPLLMNDLEVLTNQKAKNTEIIGLPADAKEAILFATLANEALCGKPITLNSPHFPWIRMGKFSLST